jgi:UDP-N-acetylmuramyl pentapeptide phosphotransferase/UDP-N-acetylglucosamine-1-phosphate transferase
MRIQILDKGGRRKIHKGVTPSMGGLIIFISFLFALIVWRPGIIMNENGRFLMSSLTLMVLTGIRDDIVPLPAFIKLLVQAIAASIAVLIMNIRIDSLYGLFGINEINPWMSYILSMFFILFITNAFNLIDGIDGLAGSIAFFCLSFLSLWNYWIGHVDQAILLSCCVGAIVGFLYYNWQPASIFMGDTGSLMLGFIIATSTLDFITHNGALPVTVHINSMQY